MKQKYGLTIAAKDHLIQHNPLTRLEAMIFFGISNLTDLVSEMRKEGWRIRSRQVPMATAVARVNKHAVLEVPKNLPQREIVVTEYWLES